MRHYSKASKAHGGFTLIELLVSSLIIALTLLAIIAMIRHSERISNNFQNRTAARAHIATILERSRYQSGNFAGLSQVFDTLKTTVILNDRGTASLTDDQTASITISHALIANTSPSNLVSPALPYVLIRARANWNELEGNDTLIVEKILCQID